MIRFLSLGIHLVIYIFATNSAENITRGLGLGLGLGLRLGLGKDHKHRLLYV